MFTCEGRSRQKIPGVGDRSQHLRTSHLHHHPTDCIWASWIPPGSASGSRLLTVCGGLVSRVLAGPHTWQPGPGCEIWEGRSRLWRGGQKRLEEVSGRARCSDPSPGGGAWCGLSGGETLTVEWIGCRLLVSRRQCACTGRSNLVHCFGGEVRPLVFLNVEGYLTCARGSAFVGTCMDCHLACLPCGSPRLVLLRYSCQNRGLYNVASNPPLFHDVFKTHASSQTIQGDLGQTL